MIPSNLGPVAAEVPQKRVVMADRAVQGPMPQQHGVGFDGHEMHPQKFVQLVGCHDQHAGKHPTADRLH
jgi:hypothetical protein